MKFPLAKLCSLIFLLGAATAYSQTLNWASLTESDIVNSHGDPLDNTYLFELGAFTDGFVPDETNVGSWETEWHVFDTAVYSYNPVDLGYFTGTQDVQSVSGYTSMFQGLKAYLWIHNTTDTEHFLASTSSDIWKFPTLQPGCCPNGEGPTWSVSNLNSDNPIWGGQSGHEGTGEHSVSGPFEIQTYVVPETGSSLLALLGIGFAVSRRRRNER
ncbi:MAG: hypothetical protein ABIS50_16475 [Luteolibacter sp.]|uniref:hypothetical protein n=1 Tax=Luteolibacter sp. TaxID=1962973 RepID=UPI0032636FA5